MSKRIFALLIVVALIVAAMPLVSSANEEPAQPVAFSSTLSECNEDLTGETLTFYHFGDLSGPYAPITAPIIAGLEDAIKYMNDNGGLCGATVAQEYRDTGGAQEQSQAFWDEFSAKEDAYVIYLYASADGELLLEQAKEQGIVLINAAASELALYGEAGEPGWQFSAVPLYVDQMGALCQYVAENWDSMGMEGDPTIGHLSWEGAFGRSTDTEQTRAYCESLGVGYAGAEYFLPGTPDISTQLQTLVDGGANIIYTTTLASGAAQVASTVATLELPVMVTGVNWTLDSATIFLGGAATNGMTGNMPILWWDEAENPAVQQVTQIWQENRLAADPESAVRLRNVGYMGAFGTLDIWAEGMIRAINEGGYENLSGEAVYNAMQTMEGYEAFGGVIRVDYTNGNRSGKFSRIGSIQFVEVDGNMTPTILPATDWAPVPSLWTKGADVPAE